MQPQDTRHLVQVGDYFNITRPASENEVWNEVNRFDTCQLTDIDEQGRWVFKEMFYQYSKGNYPFWSDSIYWDVFKYAQDTLIERIDDPETEGFKERKPFLQDKIKARIKELQESYESVARYVAYHAILYKELDEYVERLDKIIASLAIHGVEASSTAIPLNGDLPYVSVIIDGHKVMGVVETMYKDSFDVDTTKGKFNVKFTDLVPNDELYPIDFAMCHPFSSVMRSCEAESLACRILLHTKTWNNLPTWDQYYQTMTARDKQISYKVERDFNVIIGYLGSPEECAKFAKPWADILERHNATK